MLIDSHCHIDQFPHPEMVVQECEQAAVRVVAVTNLPSDFAITADRLKTHPTLSAAIGMHPMAAAKAIRELSSFRRMIPFVDYVGEIGLDYSPAGVATKAIQDRIFYEVLKSLQDRQRFVTLHSRGAEEAVLAGLQSHRIKHAVFHWFTGSERDLERIVEAGHLLSINAAMLRSSRASSLLLRIPRDSVLVETDGPFCKINDRPSGPTDVQKIYRALATALKMDFEELVKAVSANFLRAAGHSDLLARTAVAR